MVAAIVAVSWQWCKDILKNAMLWVMVALPTGIAWAVMHTGAPGSQQFSVIWLVFAQLMTGLMISSGHWLEEREQGTWQALRLSPVPIGWLLFTQAALVALVTLTSELLVFAANHGSAPLTLALGLYILFGAVLSTALGVLIGIGSPSARSGSMLSTVVMLVLFLGAVTAPGLRGFPTLHAVLGWLPSVLSISALSAGLAGGYARASTNVSLALWLLAVLLGVSLVLRKQYTDGR